MKKIVLLFISLILFANLAIAQTGKDKKQLKKETAIEEYAAIKKLIETDTYTFKGTWLTTQRGRRVKLSSGSNHIEVKKDSANASLQFFGEVRSLGSKGEGIVFNNIMKDYSVKYNDKKHKILISFRAKNKAEDFEVSMTVYKSGFAYIDIISSFRSTINYEGNLIPVKEN